MASSSQARARKAREAVDLFRGFIGLLSPESDFMPAGYKLLIIIGLSGVFVATSVFNLLLECDGIWGQTTNKKYD